METILNFLTFVLRIVTRQQLIVSVNPIIIIRQTFGFSHDIVDTFIQEFYDRYAGGFHVFIIQ